MSNERDELQKVIFGYFGPTLKINAYRTPEQQDRELADAILAAGYIKQPAPETEWGVGSKWGRHPFQTKADAEQNIELHHKSGDHARLVKRPAGTQPGPWEETE